MRGGLYNRCRGAFAAIARAAYQQPGAAPDLEELKRSFLSTWNNNGSRKLYWCQQDLPAGKTGNLAALAPTP
jgi:hypothetical protein